MERLHWKMILSLEFSWGTKRAGEMEKKAPFFLEEQRWSKDKPGLQLSWSSLRGARAGVAAHTRLALEPGSLL